MILLIDGLEPEEYTNAGDRDTEIREELDLSLVETMKDAAGICLRREGIDSSDLEVSLSLVCPERIRELNRRYRGVDRVTDVLSFPLVEDLDQLPALTEETAGAEAARPEDLPEDTPEDPASTEEEEVIPIPLGDVVICLDQARAQAEEYGHSREREIIYLFVHSMLHLLGYDHMEAEEKAEMRRREEEVMEELGLTR